MIISLKHITLLGFVLLISVLDAFTQPITGIVLDKKTQIPISFTNILAQGTTQRTTTNVEGKFSLEIKHYPASLKITALGYNDTIFRVTSSTHLKIELSLKETKKRRNLKGDVTAIAVIKKAIDYRNRNDPEANYPFTYKSYSKMTFGPTFSDSVHTSAHKSTNNERYYFISEAVTHRKFFPPDFNYERVVGNRFSGLLNPGFTMRGTDFQPFSFYKDYVKVLGLNFLSPLARKSYHNYIFELTDSYYDDRDTLYVIQFEPKPGSAFSGLKGILTINSNKYAIQKIQVSQANPYSQIKIDLEQESEYIDTLQWFPVKFKTHLVFQKKNYRPELGLVFIEATGETYIRDIKIAAKIYKEDFTDLGIVLSDKANTHTKSYWNKKRENPLTDIEKNTYAIVDSVGKVKNYDSKQLIAEGFPRGNVPIGPVSIEANKLIDYNNYEGIRLGLGVRTNDKLSRFFSVGAYGAYGFMDKAFKYGGDLQIDISRKKHIYAGVKYKNDVMVSGGNSFYKPGLFSLRTYSDIYTERMDKIDGIEAYFSFRFLRDFQNKLFYSSYNQSYNYNYSYKIGTGDTLIKTGETFKNVEVGISMRFGFRENYLNLLNQSVSLGTRFPYLWVKVAYSSPSIGSSFSYTKIDLKIEKSYRIKGLGKVGFMVMAGTTLGDAPASLLHYGRGMRSSDLGLYIESAFNTMRPNEFLSDQYATFHLNLNFGAIYKSKFSAPEVSLVGATGWGSLNNPEFHQGITFETMEKFYNEAGLLFDNIFAYKSIGLGAGVFYRMGAYAFDDASQNLATRITLFYRIE